MRCPKSKKEIQMKTKTYYNQEQTDIVKTPSFLGHLDPDIVFLVKTNT